MKETGFKGFENAAFYGKLTTTIMGLLLKKLLKDKVKPEYETPCKFVDFFVEDIGFIEVTTSKRAETKDRRKWYCLSKRNYVYIVVPKRFVEEYRNTIDLDFKIPNPEDKLPPKGARRKRIVIISPMEFFSVIEKKVDIPKHRLNNAIKTMKDSNQLSKLVQPLLEK